MRTPETSREPCPDCIIDEVGEFFGVGVIGGSAWYFLKGIYNSPNGSRLLGGAQAVRMNGPRVGGQWAVWRGFYSAMDCTMEHIRQKEDPWNSIIAGSVSSGLLSIRQGAVAASRSAVRGGVLFAMIAGAVIAINKFPYKARMQEQMLGVPENLNQDTASSLSWLGGLFGKKQDEEEK